MRLIQWSTTRIHLLLTSIILFECTILIVNNIRQSCFENSKIISKNGEEPTNLKPKYHIPPLKTRLHLPVLLYDLNLQTGLELGVQAGYFSLYLLQNWPHCKRYYLVDPWRNLVNYNDLANADNLIQDKLFENTTRLLTNYKNITKFLRMKGVDAVKQIPDRSLDFIYLDARHDYCAVKEDMESWWPKLAPGGILSGHDYMTHIEVAPAQDWTLCEDGRRELGAVKRAVDEFVSKNGVYVSVTYLEQGGASPTWIVRKPV